MPEDVAFHAGRLFLMLAYFLSAENQLCFMKVCLAAKYLNFIFLTSSRLFLVIIAEKVINYLF